MHCPSECFSPQSPGSFRAHFQLCLIKAISLPVTASMKVVEHYKPLRLKPHVFFWLQSLFAAKFPNSRNGIVVKINSLYDNSF